MQALVLVSIAIAMQTSTFSGLPESLQAIRAVGPMGEGNEEASAAWREVVQAGAGEIPQILAAMDGANNLSQNWLRAAVETIAEKQLRQGLPLPQEKFVAFVMDQSHCDPAREIAYTWLGKIDPSKAEAMIPGMLEDPCVAFRRMAVQKEIEKAKKLTDEGQALDVYAQAFAASRDVDQITELAKILEKGKRKVDVAKHFGFLMKWKVVGPFDNTGKKGFDTAYPPEKDLGSVVNLTASYEGKEGPVQWKDLEVTDKFGMADLNGTLGELKEVVGYAYTRFESSEDQQVQLRLGCKNAWKVWLNGKLLFQRDEYHRGMRIDQYTLNAPLKEGVNHLLVKACQDEQTQPWTKEWQFQLRICDAVGTPIVPVAPPQFDTLPAAAAAN